MKRVNCTHNQHAAQILEVFNDVILTSTALFDYQPRTPESMATWFKTKDAGRFPVIGVEGSGGDLLGFASYGTFRAWPAYKYSVEPTASSGGSPQTFSNFCMSKIRNSAVAQLQCSYTVVHEGANTP